MNLGVQPGYSTTTPVTPGSGSSSLANQIAALQNQITTDYQNYFYDKTFVSTYGPQDFAAFFDNGNSTAVSYPKLKDLTPLKPLAQDPTPADVGTVYIMGTGTPRYDSGQLIQFDSSGNPYAPTDQLIWQKSQQEYDTAVNNFFTLNSKIAAEESTLAGLQQTYDATAPLDPAYQQATAAIANSQLQSQSLQAQQQQTVIEDVLVAAGLLALVIVILYAIKS